MIVKINSFRPSPSHSATDSRSFRFSVKIFSQFDIAGRPKIFLGRKFFFTGVLTRYRWNCRRTMKILDQDSRFSGPDLNPGAPEDEAEC